MSETEHDETTWRPAVVAFANAMEAKLRANDHKGGWDRDSPDALMARLEEEYAELRVVVHRHLYEVRAMTGMRSVDEIPFGFGLTEEAVLGEAADVANFAMMIADVCGALGDDG
jgi:NTP pyrophosphatase (non-canonical NTP hydrolase)